MVKKNHHRSLLTSDFELWRFSIPINRHSSIPTFLHRVQQQNYQLCLFPEKFRKILLEYCHVFLRGTVLKKKSDNLGLCQTL